MPVVCVLLSQSLTFVHDSFDSASKSKSCVVTGAFIYLWQFLSNTAWKCPYVTSIQKVCCFTKVWNRNERKEAREEKTQCLENWDYFRAVAMPKIPLSSQRRKRLFNVFSRIQSILAVSRIQGSTGTTKQEREGGIHHQWGGISVIE